MIGGRFKVASVASIAAAGLFMGGVSAQAADLGGNCCADLEERVAELEATTARKGNRKVSLEVSGHVHEAIVYFDVNNSNNVNDESNIYIGTHNSSRSRFRFKGAAKINADWSAGFLMEIGVRANSLVATSQNTPVSLRGLDIRHEALYVKSKSLGTIWLGWTSSATDGITEICLGCGLGQAADFSDDLNGLLDGNGTRIRNLGSNRGIFNGEGDRREMIRYISPTLAGFVVSASAGGDDFYDVALRYAGEFGQIRIAAGVGYQRSSGESDSNGLTCGNTVNTDCESIGASGSIQHTPTGIYVYGAYGQDEDQSNLNLGRDTSWQASIGVNNKFSAMGKTNIWVMYGESEREIGFTPAGKGELTYYGVGIDQKIDAAAMDLYIWYKHFDYDDKAPGQADGEADIITIGARIQF